MNYEMPKEENGFYWTGMFEMLSVYDLIERNELQQYLGFKFKNSTELQVIAKDFVVRFRLFIRADVSIEFVEEKHKSPLSSNEDPLVAIWTDTFRELESIGQAENVYRLGMLRQWERQEEIATILCTDLQYLLVDWCLHPELTVLRLNGLNPLIEAKLQTIVLREETWLYKLRYHTNGFKRMKTEGKLHDYFNKWEVFAFTELDIDVQIYLHGRMMNRLRFWRAFFDLLDDEDLRIIEVWANSNFKRIGILEQIDLISMKTELLTGIEKWT